MRSCKNTRRGGVDGSWMPNGYTRQGQRRYKWVETQWNGMGCEYPERSGDKDCKGCIHAQH